MESLKKHSRTNSKIAFSKIRKSLEAYCQIINGEMMRKIMKRSVKPLLDNAKLIGNMMLK
jgi:hypothetical protein